MGLVLLSAGGIESEERRFRAAVRLTLLLVVVGVEVWDCGFRPFDVAVGVFVFFCCGGVELLLLLLLLRGLVLSMLLLFESTLRLGALARLDFLGGGSGRRWDGGGAVGWGVGVTGAGVEASSGGRRGVVERVGWV